MTTRAPRPARTVLLTEARLFLREPGALFWIIVFPSALLCILFAIPTFRLANDDLGGLRVVDTYVPVVVLVSTIMAAVQSMPAVLSTYREAGVLRRVATTPARPWHLLAAQWIIHGAAVVVGALVAVGIGVLALDVRVPGAPLVYATVLLLALLAMLCLGGLVAGTAPTARFSGTMSTVVLFPLLFTAGAWLPVQVMPGLLGDIVAATPLGAAALGLDAAALGEWPDVRHLAVLLVWTGGLGALAMRFFRWD